MRFKVFSVYDCKANAYLPPFFTPTVGMAIRMFSDAVHDEKSQFHKHAGDYTLFQIGEFEDSTAELTFTNHINLGSALEILSADNE